MNEACIVKTVCRCKYLKGTANCIRYSYGFWEFICFYYKMDFLNQEYDGIQNGGAISLIITLIDPLQLW